MKKLKILALMCLGHATSHWYIGVLMLVIPLIKQDLSLSFTEVGLIISVRSLAGAFGNTTSGFIVDLVGKRHLILSLSAAGIGVCWFSVGYAHSYILVLLLVPLASMFSNLWHAPAMSVVSDTYPERRGFALGMHGGAANLGQSISPVVVGLLISYFGWRTALKLHIAPGALFSVLILVLLPRLGSFELKKKTTAAFWELVKEKLLKNRALLLIAAVSVFRTMGQRAIETFLALFFADRIGLNPVWIGIYLSILTFSSTFPEPIIGWLSDHLGRRSILWISLTLSGLSVIAITLVPPGIPLMISVGLLGFFHYSLRPIIFAFALDVTPPEIGAATISYVFTWNQSISVISPLIGGFLADALGIQYALYFVALLSLMAALFAGIVKGKWTDN